MATNKGLQERGRKFAQYLALEVKGAVWSQNRGVIEVCEEAGVNQATFYRYTTGTRSIPSPLLAQMCEVLGVDPREIVNRAYTRLLNELGPYEPDAPQTPPANVQFLAYPDPDVTPQTRAAQTLGDLDNEEAGEMDQP
ncbi:MAG: helix-turn-helix transcriptional regulator [Actinomyces sp.]|nr:helix-turn-helix transcriptional regulator [Actinomyces sp.]